MKFERKANIVYRVIATSLDDAPFPSLRGEYHDAEQAKAHLTRWKEDGRGSGYIETEKRESGYLFQCLDPL